MFGAGVAIYDYAYEPDTEETGFYGKAAKKCCEKGG